MCQKGFAIDGYVSLTGILAASPAAGKGCLAIEGFGADVVFFRLVFANGKTARLGALSLHPAATAEGVHCPSTTGCHDSLCHCCLRLVDIGSAAFIVSNAVITRSLFVGSVFVLEEALLRFRFENP